MIEKHEEYLDIDEKLGFDESVDEDKHVAIHPVAGTQLNSPGDIRLIDTDQDSFSRISKSGFLIKGQLVKENGQLYTDADAITLCNNGPLYAFNSIQLQLGDHIIETVRHPGRATTMKGLLSYSTNSQQSNICWNLDTNNNADTDNNKGFKYRHNMIIKKSSPKGYFSFYIPLSHIFGFCEDYDKLIYGLNQTLTLTRTADDDAIFKAAAAAKGKVVIEEIKWKISKIIPSDKYRNKLLSLIQSRSIYNIGFRENRFDMFDVPQSTNFVWQLGPTQASERPRWAIIGFQTNRSKNQDTNPSIFDHCDVRNIYVWLNNQRFPNIDVNVNFTKIDYAEVYENIKKFRENYYGINNIVNEASIDMISFKSLYTLFVFDLRKQSERLKSSIISTKIEASFGSNAPVSTVCCCLIISDRILKYVSDGSRMSIEY
jgi:hypothetical protein